MTWFGTVSAWGAVVVGTTAAALSALQIWLGDSTHAWMLFVTAVLLLVGAFRTLRKQSGGLRLLAGAWGAAAGVLAFPISIHRSWNEMIVDLAPFHWIYIPSVIAALAGLALTVLHKEQK